VTTKSSFSATSLDLTERGAYSFALTHQIMFEDIERKKKENPGILGEAYFVGRRALLAWYHVIVNQNTCNSYF